MAPRPFCASRVASIVAASLFMSPARPPKRRLMRRPSLLVRGSHDEIEILPLTYIGDLPETSNLSKRCRPASYWFYILPDPLLLQPRGAIGDRSGRVAKAQEGATMNGVSQANCSLCSTAN